MQIKVVANVLKANRDVASENRALLKELGIKVVNLISSPGAGKTTLLERTIADLKEELPLAVIEGDLMTTRDGERIGRHGVPVVQINTGGGCHLDAAMVKKALEELPLKEIKLLIIENVGNLVCPSSFDLGEDEKVVIISVPEGDDKPAKYPVTFRRTRLCLLNKIDLLPYSNFNVDNFYRDVRALNPEMKVLQVSALTGEGMEAWYNYLRGLVQSN
ncbi:MAG: hydrogenase nickel incorporation protein HypB [Eubacteriales bacterium]|nr:hydrogenase nickel incorporation protein HypB [Eubacteriales bacterium]MDN5364012.1 hydrogenase nickel incorporation protein HypB [Eubacteriales bacterium]